jgi:excisionase family DNA binding protein
MVKPGAGCPALAMARDFWSNEQTVSNVGKHGPGRQTGNTGAVAPFLMTTEEMADLLRTSRTAIYAMVGREQLPGVVRIGRRVLFRRADVMKWLAQL